MMRRIRIFLPMLILLLATLNVKAQTTFVSNTDESKVPPYQLPDLLKMVNGKTVKDAKEWTSVQRPYLYHLYELNQFGTFPKLHPAIRFRILENDATAFAGTATRKQVRIFLHPTDTTIYTDLLLYIPNKAVAPVPVFIGYNFGGNQCIQSDPGIRLTEHWVSARSRGSVNNHAADSSRGAEASQWQVAEILSHGYAVATAYCGDLEPDHPEGWKTGIRTSLQQSLQLAPDEWGAMGAWAYGLCRMVDYLEKDAQIDAKKIAVIGHSRLGKAALWAAASDQRFSLVVSNESGEGGATLSRRWYGETVKIINTKFPYWFGAKYKTFGDDLSELPVDGHMLLSLMAPRPLYVASAEGDQWSDPYGEFLSAREAGKAYALFHLQGISADSMPGLHQPTGDRIRYHIRAGKHDVTLYDWQQYLAFADRHWKQN